MIKFYQSAILSTAVLLVCIVAHSAIAESVVSYDSGMVVSGQRGDFVALGDGLVVPTNLHGLLQSGQVVPGDIVDVKIVSDKGKKHKHHGHVTILK